MRGAIGYGQIHSRATTANARTREVQRQSYSHAYLSGPLLIYLYSPTGEIETRWGPVHTATAPEEKPRYASGDYSEDNEDYCYDYDHDNEQPAGDHSEDNKDYCYDYDYGNEQPSFGLQFQGGGYDGGSQGQNDHSAPPEGGSDEYPESSPRWYQTASGGVDERDVGASRHGPRRGYNIMSGDDQEPDVQTPRHPYGSYESEDGEQDISSQDPKKNSRRKGKAPAQDEPPPYKQGNSSSHSGHDRHVALSTICRPGLGVN